MSEQFKAGDRVKLHHNYWHPPLQKAEGTVTETRPPWTRMDLIHAKEAFIYAGGMIRVRLDDTKAWNDHEPWFAPHEIGITRAAAEGVKDG